MDRSKAMADMRATGVDRRGFLRLAGGALKLAGGAMASGLLPGALGCAPDSGPARRPNILFICSDQHQAAKLGHRGHPIVRTPNIDRLAAEGAQFTRAYCNAPICGPARMSMFTGKYIHRLGVWLNGVALPQDEIAWGDRLRDAGMRTSAHGKVGVVGMREDVGFADLQSRERHPVYQPWPFDSPFDQRLVGHRQPLWWLDQPPATREQGLSELRAARRIESGDGLHFGSDMLRRVGYYDEDRETTDRSLEFLRRQAKGGAEQPPFLHFVGLMQPHFPFIAPKAYSRMYDPADVDLPADAHFPNPSLHPAVRFFQQARPFDMDERKLRRIIATYYGMISCMDDMLGELLAELDRSGLAENTYVVYITDHGESLGAHGLFDKQTSYEDSIAVPLIIRGPGIASGQRFDRPMSLIDLHPTLLELGGLPPESGDRPGKSLLPLLEGRAEQEEREVFSEYHGGFFQRDWCMLVRDQWKYTWYANDRPSLFDLREDPDELHDLAPDSSHAKVVRELDAALRRIADPDAVSRQAKRDLGLIGPDGTDYAETLSWEELQAGRETGRFAPSFRAEMNP
jgi:choline-sulfatase